jgi:sn-glycerol 3-phosphate transport system substrate-binding protein
MRGLAFPLFLASLALAQVSIPFWHTAGPPGDKVLEEAIRSFNESQKAYCLEARYVGDYREAGVKLLSALRAGGPRSSSTGSSPSCPAWPRRGRPSPWTPT